MAECIFSGELADSEEHVIPKWLQARFNLWNQTLVLPNGTTLPYRQVRVLVKTEDNGRFSVIEASMARGTSTTQEAYLWALKIHIGLIYRDARLKIARADPKSTAILDVDDFVAEVAKALLREDDIRDDGRKQDACECRAYLSQRRKKVVHARSAWRLG